MAAKPGNPKIRVRVARGDDAMALVPLFDAFYGAYFGEPVTPISIARRLRQTDPDETVVVAEVDGRLTGFASLRVTHSLDPAPYAEMTDLFVESAARRLGVASRLVRYLEGTARERGAAHLVVLTGRTNTEAQAFYRSVGYEEYAVAMRKALTAAETR
ncbi:MAG: GNAT family N-acetyltransferase [Thermoplasmata archaeon]|nr:GNAT family N-acetyltransferase [Thermoplasmata archaeon]